MPDTRDGRPEAQKVHFRGEMPDTVTAIPTSAEMPTLQAVL